MPFHVEVRDGLRRARVFNLEEAELRRTILVPFADGGPIYVGEQEFVAREAELRVLEGPALAPSDLAHGRGWDRARRRGADVTTELLSAGAAAVVAVLAATIEDDRAAAAVLGRIGVAAVDWPEVRQAWLGGDPRGLVLLVAGDPAPGGFLFEAGLTIGALSRRVLAAHRRGTEPPAELAGLQSLPIAVQAGADDEALARRLRAAGDAVRPRR
jgi:hypothetical protein